MKKVILVEDSKEIHQMVKLSLNGLCQLEVFETISEAKESLKDNEFDLLLLDIELPDGNGLELCSHVQSNYPLMPIFLLTSNDSLSDKVLGFSAGADDYITKPFDFLELKARVESKLKKMDLINSSADIMEWSEIKINKLKQKVEILDNDKFKEIELTSLEFKLLAMFANSPGHVIARDVILDDIWGKDVHVYSRSVDTHVSKLRKKLECQSELIQSVHGAGYKFEPS